MIFVRIDDPQVKNVTGFECGTRAEFDQRHPNDPLWIFFDADMIKLRINTQDFLNHPTTFFINTRGVLRKKSVGQ